ncbi:GTPase ObgE [Cerasicoccus arenae]|uniref:GTPase Obg n=1 Tax=Cerasicoccus arenae TaxID=424488 RepID=A0A8J3DA68_9BACT|nr:GTPase ObgE [Cerasicoccus arenae]MBK1859421.1 GTPase ObgE [Cerasicoccus arenae]GHB94016.1 GTPase ObgE [Cerasicoccus arenae]
MFVDEVKVKLKAGDGGNGCLSFRREKYEPRGGPNGGNGGRGGDVVLVGDENTTDLVDYKFMPHATAQNGEPGRGADQHGASGDDKRLRLPLGVQVYDTISGQMVCELLEHGQEIILLNGGRGGLGNQVFKSSVNQAPRKITPGKPGEEGEYRLELKTIADCGLVGFPNAGKSSIMGLMTKNHPKIGHYAFTTLQPSVGVLEFPETYERLTIADIPGLIEGAHENKGLGHRFLRHIERCRMLLFMIDMAGEENRDPLEDYAMLCNELELYQEDLKDRARIIIANKIDEQPAAGDNLKRFRAAHPDLKVIPISCLSEEGVSELRDALYNAIISSAAE